MPSFLSRIPDKVHSIPTLQLFILLDLHRTSPTQALARSACQFWKKEPLRGSKTSDLDLIGMRLTIHGGRRYHGCCCCCIIACATEVSYAACKKRYQVYEFRRILVSSRGLFLRRLLPCFIFFLKNSRRKCEYKKLESWLVMFFFSVSCCAPSCTTKQHTRRKQNTSIKELLTIAVREAPRNPLFLPQRCTHCTCKKVPAVMSAREAAHVVQLLHVGLCIAFANIASIPYISQLTRSKISQVIFPNNTRYHIARSKPRLP